MANDEETFLDWDDWELLTNTNETLEKADIEDLDVAEKESQIKHMGAYDSILESYKTHTEKLLKSKRTYQSFFFWVSLSILIISFILLIFTLVVVAMSLQNTDVDVASIIALVVAVIAEFLTTFIILPKIIAEYLFNRTESKAVATIVKNMQEYDLRIRDSNI